MTDSHNTQHSYDYQLSHRTLKLSLKVLALHSKNRHSRYQITLRLPSFCFLFDKNMIEAFVQRFVASWLGKLLIGTAAFLFSARYAGGVYAYLEAEKCERPTYTVVQKLTDGVEIRQYEPYMIAETTADDESSSFEKAGKTTFGTLAGYIFGRNKARRGGESEKMAMTAPVRFDGGDNKKTRYVRSWCRSSLP